MPREFPRFMIIRGKSAENAEGVLTHNVTDKTNGPGLGVFMFSTQEAAAKFINSRFFSKHDRPHTCDRRAQSPNMSKDSESYGVAPLCGANWLVIASDHPATQR